MLRGGVHVHSGRAAVCVFVWGRLSVTTAKAHLIGKWDVSNDRLAGQAEFAYAGTMLNG